MVLNLVVWLVVAMAGFAFPLRLDTSMAEFDFGKLFCTLFLARGVIQLILDAALWLVMLSIAEPWLGRARTVGTALACALGGVIVGLTLCAAAGWLFQDSQFVSRMQFALSPLVLPVGALMAASAFCSHLLRRRIRLIGYVASLVAWLFVLIAAAAIGGGYACWGYGILHGSMERLAIASYATPVLSTGASAVLLGLALSLPFWCGALLVAAGSVLNYLVSARK